MEYGSAIEIGYEEVAVGRDRYVFQNRAGWIGHNHRCAHRCGGQCAAANKMQKRI